MRWHERALAVWHNDWRIWDNAVAGLIIVAGCGFLAWRFGPGPVTLYLTGLKSGVYSTLAGVAGAMLGFVIMGVSILLTFGDSPRIRALRETKQYDDVFAVFTSAWRWLGVTTLLTVSGNLVDTQLSPKLWFAALVGITVIMSSARLGRSLWALENMIKVVVVDKSQPEPTTVEVPVPASESRDGTIVE